MTVTYWKGKLKNAGIVDISKLQVVSQERVRNKECKILWLKKAQNTLMCFCDAINILEPWTILNLVKL
jgi:hypothetical protein